MKFPKKPMKKPNIVTRVLDFLNNTPGEHKTSDIADAIGASVSATSTKLNELSEKGEIKKISQGIFTKKDHIETETPTETPLADEVDALEKEVYQWKDVDNQLITNRLMHVYNRVIGRYETWISRNVNEDTDFDAELKFIDTFKAITLIGDKLMKRWALTHVGYDTNSRQAQEDAKAKTEERQKEALKDAPLEEQIVVVGSYDPEAKELLDCIPSSLEDMTDEEAEQVKV